MSDDEDDFAVLITTFKKVAVLLHKHHPRQNQYADKIAEGVARQNHFWNSVSKTEENRV
jgi:hypothetical protein